jgi:hypothetical protein
VGARDAVDVSGRSAQCAQPLGERMNVAQGVGRAFLMMPLGDKLGYRFEVP